MACRPAVPAAVLVAALLWSGSADAETLRCRNSLIQEGATPGYVLEKCGEPESKMQITEPVRARRPNGSTYVTGHTTTDVWRYNRGHGKFPAILTFRGGVLKKIEFEK